MRVTLRDIAKKLNLSHATVSFVLNERTDVSIPMTTRERVMKAAKEMGYRPNRAAQALVRGKTNMVALWVPSPHNNFYTKVIREIETQASIRGFHTVVRIAKFDVGLTDRVELDDWPVDAVITVDCALAPSFNFDQPISTPIVNLGAYADVSRDHVTIDLGSGVREAMTHFREQGCRRIAHLTIYNPGDMIDPRRASYLQACEAFAIQPELITVRDGSRVGVRTMMKEYIAEKGCPEAIVAYNDIFALSTVRALADMGLGVPKDCLLVGCDGIDEGEFYTPSLSTIVQPVNEACEVGWGMIDVRLQEIERRREEEAVYLAEAMHMQAIEKLRGGKVKRIDEVRREFRSQLKFTPTQGRTLKSRLVIRESSVKPK